MRRAIAFVLAMLPALAVAAPGQEIPQADRVVIDKSERTLTLYAGARRLAGFWVSLGAEPVGRKVCRGDNRTPEGRYYVSGRKENSDFHRALRLSYPSEGDIERARQLGCEPGGDIMIHGLKNEWPGAMARRHLLRDWTRGCIAVTNEEIEKIWAMVPDGVDVEIRP